MSITRKLLGLGILSALTLASLVFAQKGGSGMMGGKEITVSGTLIDTKCFGMNHKNAGNDHMTPKGKMKACAAACATMGVPVGVLDEDGKVSILITPAAQLSDHMAAEVRVKGMAVFAGGGLIPHKIEVKDGNKWVEVKVGTMM